MALLSYNRSNKPKFSQKLHHVEIHNTFLRNAQFHWPYTPIRPNLKIIFLNNLQYMVNLEKNQNFYQVIRHAQRTSCWYFLQKSFVFIFNSKFQLKTHSQVNSKTVSQHENIPNNNFVSLIPFFFPHTSTIFASKSQSLTWQMRCMIQHLLNGFFHV